MSIEIYYIDKETDKELCFKHAVQMAAKGRVIQSEVEAQDLDESGIMRIHDCYMCDVKTITLNTKEL